jgi:hypothetical protein
MSKPRAKARTEDQAIADARAYAAQTALEKDAWLESHEVIPELELTAALLQPVLFKAEGLLGLLDEYNGPAQIKTSRLALRAIRLWEKAFQAAVAVEKELDRLGFGPRKEVVHLAGPFVGIWGVEQWLKGMRLGARPSGNSVDDGCGNYWGQAIPSGFWRLESWADPPDVGKVLPELLEHVKQLRSDCPSLKQVSSMPSDRFADFARQPRKLLTALDGKGKVLIADAFRAVYGRKAMTRVTRASLLGLVRRTRDDLPKKNHKLTIQQEGDTLELVETLPKSHAAP